MENKNNDCCSGLIHSAVGCGKYTGAVDSIELTGKQCKALINDGQIDVVKDGKRMTIIYRPLQGSVVDIVKHH